MPRSPQCPVCPGCEQPPTLAMPGGVQAFCGNEECHVFAWNPSLSLEDNMSSADYIDVTYWPRAHRGDA